MLETANWSQEEDNNNLIRAILANVPQPSLEHNSQHTCWWLSEANQDHQEHPAELERGVCIISEQKYGY